MSTVYEIDIATGTRYGIVNVTKLQAELEADHVITSTLESVAIDGDDVDITYETALPTSPVDHEAHMESIVAMHDGGEIESDVDPVVLKPTSDLSYNMSMHSEAFTATLNTDTNHDISFSIDRMLQGMNIEVVNHTDGDWIRVAMIPPSTTTELYVMVHGGSDCSEGLQINPSGISCVACDSAVMLTATYRIRFKYHSVGTTGDAPKFYILMKTWTN